jgi:uncharacterized repeat protein (TIGR01451 family)
MHQQRNWKGVFFMLITVVLAAGVVYAILAGASRIQSSLAAPAAPNDVMVAIYDFYFDPADVMVSPGTTVRWYNHGDVDHTINIPGVVTSDPFSPGYGFTYTFNILGTFAYSDDSYTDMQGVVHVVNPDQVPVDLWLQSWKDQTVSPGTTIDYYVEVVNSDYNFGTQSAVLTVTLPSECTFMGSDVDGNPYPPDLIMGNVLVYNLGSLTAADYRVIHFQIDLPAWLEVNTEVFFSARIKGYNPDPDLDNNYSETTELIPGANMTISIRPSYDSGPFVPGGVVTYTVEYYNMASYVEATSVVITDQLPSGVTFLSALNDDWTTVTPIVPSIVDNELIFNLGTLPPWASGQLLIQVQLDPNLHAKTVLRNTVGVVTTAMESTYEDNWAFDEQSVVPTLPDLWVWLQSSTDGQIDDYQEYWINQGNTGPLDANNVTVTLSIPSSLAELDFGIWPDVLITRTNDYLATWFVGTLEADSGGYGLSAYGRINAAGEITATASIISSSPEADPTDNISQVSDFNAEILMPIIDVPNTAIVGSQPVFYGLGQPGATVTLFLSGTLTVPGQVIGQTSVDDYSRWVLTPTLPFTFTGWHWFTATQQLNGRISPVTGVGNFITDTNTLIFDTNSMVRYLGTRPFDGPGEPVGGINQPLGWRPGVIYTLGARLTRCAPYEPITPTLQVKLYNDEGLMVSHHDLPATYTETVNGYVEFEFETPEDSSPFELFLNYYCPVLAIQAGGVANNSLQPSGWWQDLKDWFGCWESLGCDKPDPPPPPKPGCPGCTPIPRPRRRPEPTDPDGFVYDCAMVRAGATIAQSIITRAWVTATQRIAEGEYVPWNALDYDQVNPQYTGPVSVWPDLVPRLGYFSFLVPAGSYRLLATAPGYVPFRSPVLYVTNSPVTLNVPMLRPGDVGICTSAPPPPLHKIYLPITRR